MDYPALLAAHYENEKQEISIHDEVRFISDYISLMRLRVPGNVDVKYVTNIPEDCHAKIAPMILISLVENAYWYRYRNGWNCLMRTGTHGRRSCLTTARHIRQKS